jgi:hypothetical protein
MDILHQNVTMIETISQASSPPRQTDNGVERLNIAELEWRKMFTEPVNDTSNQRGNREAILSIANQQNNYHWGD